MSRIILDIDRANGELRTELEKDSSLTMPGLWGFKVGDLILEHGLSTTLCPLKKHNVMVDLKHYDVADRIARIVKLYADQGEFSPQFLTISGRCTPTAIHEAVKARGTINIIVTTVLSDDDFAGHADDEVLDLWHTAIGADAQGITCPAWILPELDFGVGWDGYVIATGVVSDNVDPRHHFNPRPLEFALEHGATHIVVGTEVIGNDDPQRALIGLAARCNKYKMSPA